MVTNFTIEAWSHLEQNPSNFRPKVDVGEAFGGATRSHPLTFAIRCITAIAPAVFHRLST